ncbi:hypothetical protein LPJ53_000182 [Coemansia erecta]|uniref:Adhesin domain-containing protein n=1 Tax=Coemansia erecta TaxID=147472 RepID=A0A9W7Y7N8_9FUNG|nr:hypothetical protein LPJ53_000182 [Coemansia erecta]
MPRNSQLLVRDITSGALGRLDIAVIHGSADIRSVSVSSMRVAMGDGAICARNISAVKDAEFVSIRGTIELRNCTVAKTLSTKTKYADIDIHKVKAPRVDIEGGTRPTKAGLIEADSFRVHSNSGSVTIECSVADLKIATRSGPIHGIWNVSRSIDIYAASAIIKGASKGLTVDQIRPKELEAVRGFAFDRPIFIHATNVSSSSLVIEPDMNPENRDTAIVIAEVSAQKSDIYEKCEITAQVNSHGEYDFHVNSNWSLWSMAMVRCRFVVRLPLAVSRSHPGIRAELSNSNIDIGQLTNIEFDHIDIKAQNAPLTFNGIRAGYLRAATTNCEVRVTNATIGTVLDIKTSNARIALTTVRGDRISAKTTNSSIVLQSVAGQAVNAETNNAKLHCDDVTASELHLQTHNSTIVSNKIKADHLYLVTANAKIEGIWEIKHMLDISTTNSKVDGYILLSDPMARANMRIRTTNARIKMRLPANSFSGGFDARTSNRPATVEYRDKKTAVSLPPLQFVVNDRHYKRGFLGNVAQSRHEFSASTSNSAIDIEFV